MNIQYQFGGYWIFKCENLKEWHENTRQKQKKNILNILQSLNIEYHQPDGYSIFSIEYNIEYPISLLLQSGDKPSLCTSPDQGYNHTGVQYKINMDLFLS